MIILSPEQLYEKIEEGGIKYITWYEGYVPNPKEQRQMFHRFRGESPADVTADAQKILQRYNGSFTVSMLPTDKGTAIPPIVVRVQAIGGQNMAMNGAPNNNQLSYQQLYDKVLEDVKKEMLIQSKDLEIANLKNQLNGIQGQGDKLAYVGMKIVEGFLAKNNPNLKQAIQGISDAEIVKDNTSMSGETKAPEPPKDKAKLAAAFDKLYALMGEDLLITVADKLEANPDKVQLIKTFL